jgi:hypothetical protein
LVLGHLWRVLLLGSRAFVKSHFAWFSGICEESFCLVLGHLWRVLLLGSLKVYILTTKPWNSVFFVYSGLWGHC